MLYLQKTTHCFEDLVESAGNTTESIVQVWQKQATQSKPEKKKARRSLGSMGKKRGALLKMKDKSSEPNVFEELADITEFSEITGADLSELSGSDEENLNNNILKDSFDKESPIPSGTLPESNPSKLASIPLNDDGTMMIRSSEPAVVHFIVKRTPSKYNPGLESLFVKLVECQHLSDQPDGPPNSFVESTVGTQLYISGIEQKDKNPVFTEEYWL